MFRCMHCCVVLLAMGFSSLSFACQAAAPETDDTNVHENGDVEPAIELALQWLRKQQKKNTDQIALVLAGAGLETATDSVFTKSIKVKSIKVRGGSIEISDSIIRIEGGDVEIILR
jgi:hypothetical protein